MKMKAFVLMPINEKYEDIWKLGIKKTLEDAGYSCERADAPSSAGLIVQQIYQKISDADIIIGEMTDANPNVFFEVGYALALGKEIVLLASAEADLKVFDLRGYRHVLYNNKISYLSEKLSEVLDSINSSGIYFPEHHNGEVLYEWPNSNNDEPAFKWSNNPKGVDLNGGQFIKDCAEIGQVIHIENTKEFWNWHASQSIMRLTRPHNKNIRAGDKVYLLLQIRARDNCEFVLLGDGSHININGEKKWCNSWDMKKYTHKKTPGWVYSHISVEVIPTNNLYDPSINGTTVYLVSNVSEKWAEIRRIKLICLHI